MSEGDQEGTDYAASLEAVLASEARRPLTLPELVRKGNLIQLASGHGMELSEAEAAYLKALEIDRDYVPAILDLAWYYHAVQDSSDRALPLFGRAINILKTQLAEAMRGQVECTAEVLSEEAAEQLKQKFGAARWLNVEGTPDSD